MTARAEAVPITNDAITMKFAQNARPHKETP
jgi:hypothetical protein